MSYPILYDTKETEFSSNGIGSLSDAISCTSQESRNGVFELTMRYPVDGVHYDELKQLGNIILAKPNPHDRPQPFRIVNITEPINGIVTLYCQHVSYDLSWVPIGPFTAGSASDAMTAFNVKADIEHPFLFFTDVATSATMTVEAPDSIRGLMGGQAGSVLDNFGGEYKFDRFQVNLFKERGEDRGFVIGYGKNLTDLNQERSIKTMFTGVRPFWQDIDGGLVELPEKILYGPGTYDVQRIKILDLSSEWEDAPTVDQLRTRAQRYMSDNNVGIPSVSLSVKFAQLSQSDEYKDLALFEHIELCDTVTVEFEKLGVSVKAKVIEVNYNVLLDRYESISLGDARTTFADTIVESQKVAQKSPTVTAMQQAIDHQTKLITGNKGGFVVLYDADNDSHPDEVLVMDTDSIDTAKNVLRINKSGIGFSSTGYAGPYGTAWTLDGVFNASYITAGTLDAGVIGAKTITADKINIKDLHALDATIGGYTIDEERLYSGGTGMSKNTSQFVFWSGETNGEHGSANSNAPFKVGGDGRLQATGAIISGVLNATSGVFESITITGSSFSGNLNNAGGTVNSVSGTVNGLGGNITNMLGSYSGGHYSGLVSSCNLGGTSLITNTGSTSYVGTYPNGIQVYSPGIAQLSGGGSSIYCNSVGAHVSGTLYVNGSLATTAFKSRLMQTEHFGDVCLDANETPMPTFSDYGTAKLDEDGVCYITIDPVFAEVVNTDYAPTVFLTKYGEGDIWVENVEHGITVIRGTPGLRFAWETRYLQANVENLRFRNYGYAKAEFSDSESVATDAEIWIEHNDYIDYARQAQEMLDVYDAQQVDYAQQGFDDYIKAQLGGVDYD